VTPDDKLSTFIDRLVTHLRAPLETDLHAFAPECLLESEAARSSAVSEAVAAARSELQGQVDRLQEEMAQVRRVAAAEVAEIRKLAAADIEGARRQAESHVDEARRAAEFAARERAAIQQSLDEMHHAATLASETLSGVAARTQQIVDMVRTIDAAGSIGDALDQVAQAAQACAGRSVLLMVRGSGLTVWRASDFHGLASGTLHVDDGGLIAAAVSERRPRTRLEGTRDADAPLPRFAADAKARDAVALPIVLGGETVAVLYADAPRGGDTTDRRWPLALEVVTRHASRVIEAMTLRSLGLPVPAGARREPRESETAS
jgi:hypothetical protein